MRVILTVFVFALLGFVKAEDAAEGKCVMYGDPHVLTFDGKRFNAGAGAELVAASAQTLHTGEQCRFDLKLETSTSASAKYTYIKGATLSATGYVINLSTSGVKVNGKLLKSNSTEGPFTIRLLAGRNRYTVANKDCGYTLRSYRAVRRVALLVNKQRYAEKISGFCGNFDSNPDNDVVDVAADPCFANKWKSYRHQEYMFVSQPQEQPDAKDDCVKRGGKLASILNLETDEYLRRVMKGCGNTDAWIGLERDASKKTMKWIDGAIFNYRAESNDFDRDNKPCVRMAKGSWGDRICNVKNTYICKKCLKDQWRVYKNDEYMYVHKEKKQPEAEAYCKNHNARLASVLDANIDEILRETMHACGGSHAWIGLQRNPKNRKQMIWKDGSSFSFKPKNNDFVDDNQTCVRLTRGGWHDNDCNLYKYNFICKRAIQDGII